MAVPDLTQEQNQARDAAKDATAEVFLLAFQALPVEHQMAVLRKLLAAVPEREQPVARLLASIARDRWTPPDGSPDSVDLLREDRTR